MKCSGKDCDAKIKGGKRGNMCDEYLYARQGSVPDTTGKSRLVDCPLLSYLSLTLHESGKDMIKRAVLEFIQTMKSAM